MPVPSFSPVFALIRETRGDSAVFRRAIRKATATASRSLVPGPDIAYLRSHTCESGYRNVYRKGEHYVAKVKEGGVCLPIPGSRSPNPHQCAAFVVAYYRARFGERWREVLETRQRLYWKVVYSASRGGWVLVIWRDGRKQLMTDAATGTIAVFSQRAVAVTFARVYLPLGGPLWRPPDSGSPERG